MKGFDPKFRDFPDYIVGITKEIWEDRGLATLHEYYAPNIVVRMPGSVSTGNQGVIAATAATLAEFPDRTLLGEDVIWSGTPEDGMLSSHRILSTATHLGDGQFGAATGKKLVYRILADCHAKNNAIDDEWLIRDNGAVVRQMGWEPKEYTRDLIAREGGPEACAKPLTPDNDLDGPYQGRGNENAWGQRHADLLRRMMKADMTAVTSEYDRAVQSEYPGGATGHGRDPVDRFWMSLRASLPSAKFTVHHQIGRDDPNMPPRSAIRWSLHGKHDGWGCLGAPTGADLYVLGISHAEWGELIGGEIKLRREWTLLDETAIWKQILLHTGDL
ncbi:SnoaL-like polyketide cyclase [Pelagimonas phthalicica]|uniref:SnoaL-like polyketide cyclase n=1 Tax=Pelagimonas phthalicica TaxID=1037362 RepID=A0A238JIR6_9RHOB|nr:nuclear transport factor 2 family protein [Pelagimonas phthalicica]TDS89917.1 SnoaL-like polyketide cyclase [Pelagimonas phthalicica]SMX30084.1 SnoaL-like polyketide cyclase [Pelagimonas phthalicica]